MEKNLNPEQLSAIKHGNGPLLIIAGAGTGKTTVITERIKYLLLEKKIEPHEILALTFTDKAAFEMEERVDKLLPYGYSTLEISTFHAFCERILRNESVHIGISPYFTLMDEAENILFFKKHIYKLSLSYFRPLSNPTKFAGAILTHFSRLKDEDITPAQYLEFSEKIEDQYEKIQYFELATVFKEYEDIKKQESVMDFSDVIANVLHLFRTKPNVLKKYQVRFKFVLVDEFQDTNYAQNVLSILLAGDDHNITVVADDDQSIYRWRGAAISNVLQFKKNFSETKIITLTKNYRSTQQILDSSYQMIQYNNPDRLEVQEKIDKHLISQRKIEGKNPQVIIVDRLDQETDTIVSEIKGLVKKKKYTYADIAILVRANNHAHAITSALSRNKIPYQLGGPGQLLSQPEIKDLIAYLTVLSDITDSVSLFKVLSIPIFNIKAVELSYILGTAKKQNWNLFEALEKIQTDQFLKPETKEKLKIIKEMIERHLERTKVDTPGQILYYFVTDSGLAKMLLEGDTTTTEAVTANIARFFDMLKNFELTTRETGLYETLEWINLLIETGESPSAATLDLGDIDAVHVQTVHGSKGLEYPVVFLVNLVNGRFPTRERSEKLPIPEALIKETLPTGDFHTQEERRLFYVGMTRARDLLYLTAAKYYGEGKRERKISPFVFEAVPDAKEFQKKKREQLSLPDLLEEFKPMEKEEEKGTPLHLTSISYTQIQTFDICPLHYKARYILGLPTPSSAAQSFGISLHETLDEFYKIVLSGEKVSKEFLLELLPKHWKSAGYDGKVHEEEAIEKARKILSNYYDKEFKPEHKPVALEMPFAFWIDNNNLRVGGKIDRIDRLDDKIKIIDYKTGKPNGEKYGYNLQLGIYALAASKVRHPLLQKKPEEVVLELQYLETGEKIEKSFTATELEKFEREIIEKVREIENSDFKCSESPLCKSCEFKILCDYQ